MPLVSVIVPNYNHGRFLERRLESIFNQDFTDYEVILLDDGSIDNSHLILEKYSKHPLVSNYIVNTANSGNTFMQWEKGLKQAKGDYIWIAESDDWAENDFLSKLLICFKKNDELGLAYCQSYVVNENDEIQYLNTKYTDYLDGFKWKYDYTNPGINEINDFLVFRNIIPNVSSVLFSRKFMKLPSDLYGYSYLGDWYLYCSILAKSNIAYIKQPLNYYRMHPDTVRNKAITDGRRELEYFRLLRYLSTLANVNLLNVRNQILSNYKNWIKKRKAFDLKQNFKISIQFSLAILYFIYFRVKRMNV
jgi:glycosyltransferase involved in cell wall biosynthesis